MRPAPSSRVVADDGTLALGQAGQSVEPDLEQGAHATLERFTDPQLQRFEETAAMGEAGERVGIDLDAHTGVAARIADRGQLDAHAVLAVQLVGVERRFDRQRAAVTAERLHTQTGAGPFAPGARDQRAFQRGLAVGVEEIHDRRAGEVGLLGVAQQLQAGGIDAGDDAFLHVDERARGTREDVLHALPVFLDAALGERECAHAARRFELAHRDGLETLELGERDEVLRAGVHDLRHRMLVHVDADDDDRQADRVLVAITHRAHDAVHAVVGEHEQERGILGLGGGGKRPRFGDPCAMGGSAGSAQRLADGFSVVLARAHHDDGHCARISHQATPRMDAEFCRHASIHYHDAVHRHARRPWSQCLVKCREMSFRPDWRELLALKTAGRARALGSGSARRGAQYAPISSLRRCRPRAAAGEMQPGPQGRRARGRIVRHIRSSRSTDRPRRSRL